MLILLSIFMCFLPIIDLSVILVGGFREELLPIRYAERTSKVRNDAPIDYG